MRTKLLLASLAGATAIALSLPALAADTAQDFVNKAAIGGMFEVESSKLAYNETQDSSVKDFAHMMVRDHTGANAKLEKIAGEQKLSVPSGLDAEHQAILDRLNAAEGEAFVKAYLEAQRSAHDEAVSLFEGYAKDGDNVSLKAFANDTLPTLKAHQEKVDTIAKTADGNPAVSSTSSNESSDTGAGAPVPGANSFTEAQAKDRIQDAGYTDVSGLAKDDNGIWRGEAKRDGKSVPVALDYQGNVSSQAN
jgi:putative membrane protein